MTTRPALLCAVLLALPCAAARAQENPPQGGPAQQAATPPTQPETPQGGPAMQAATPPAGQGLQVELRTRGSLTFRADIDDTPGDVQIWRAGFGATVAFQPFERAQLSFGIDEEASWYLFHDAVGLIPSTPPNSDPFELALITTFSPRLSVVHDQHWAWFVGGLFQFAGEPDVDISDSATYGGYAGARYAFSENFALSFGFAAKTRLEDNALIIPLIGVDWKITDRVSLNIEGTFATFNVKLTDQWSCIFSGGWELREFRLNDDNVLPDGVVRDSRTPVGIGFEWKPSPKITLAITGGAVIWQKYTIDDSSGDRVSKTNTDPAPFIGLSATFRF